MLICLFLLLIIKVAYCYSKECSEFPQQLIELLQNNYQVIHPDLRRTMVQSLVLMRNKDLISTTSLLSLFFTLFRCRDKALRTLLHNHIVSDIKNANAKHKNNKLNKTLQNFMYTMLKDSTEVSCKIRCSHIANAFLILFFPNNFSRLPLRSHSMS
jgi:protein SDA1